MSRPFAFPFLLDRPDDPAGLVLALVLDDHHVGQAARGIALRHLDDLAADGQLVSGHDRPRIFEALLCLQEVLAWREQQALAPVAPRAA